MIGLAILGAGIFARDEYLPAIKLSKKFVLKAVYSRSQSSSNAFAITAASQIDTYFDTPEATGRSLPDLLSRPDIGAIVVCLPIPAQPEIIRKALAAGKAVLSEKPISKDAITAKSLLEWHSALPEPRPIWGIAENFRVLPSTELAVSKIKQLGGELVTFRLRLSGLMDDDNKYTVTEWRKAPAYQGGYLLDGGIHGMAVLRLFLTAAGHEVNKVACFSRLLQGNLPPVDSIYATGLTDGGRAGLISMSFGTRHDPGWEVEITTTNGVVNWKDHKVTVIQDSDKKDIHEFEPISGNATEMDVFAQGIENNQLDARQSPTEALKDLYLLEALLRSGEDEATTTDVAKSI